MESFQRAVQSLEAEYEVSESADVERQYIIANASLGRARLAVKEYDGALIALDGALGLLPSDTSSHDSEAHILRSQCLLLKALAYFLKGEAEASLQAFDEAQTVLQTLTPTDSNQIKRLQNQATLMLAQVLYGLGGDDQRAEAERQLLDK